MHALKLIENGIFVGSWEFWLKSHKFGICRLRMADSPILMADYLNRIRNYQQNYQKNVYPHRKEIMSCMMNSFVFCFVFALLWTFRWKIKIGAVFIVISIWLDFHLAQSFYEQNKRKNPSVIVLPVATHTRWLVELCSLCVPTTLLKQYFVDGICAMLIIMYSSIHLAFQRRFQYGNYAGDFITQSDDRFGWLRAIYRTTCMP